MVICLVCDKVLSHKKRYNKFCSVLCSNRNPKRKNNVSDEYKDKLRENLKLARLQSVKVCKGKTIEEIMGTEKGKQHKIKLSESLKGKSLGRCKNPEKEKLRKERISNGMNKLYREGGKHTSDFKKTKYLLYKNFLQVHGNLELQTCAILDKLKEEEFIYDWEYTNDRVKYKGLDNKDHMYLIDFKIFQTPEDSYYLETKGWEQPVDKLKWAAVRELGHSLVVWKKKEIKELQKIFDA
jgi:hypothetical protein